jgi:hypothetical protein
VIGSASRFKCKLFLYSRKFYSEIEDNEIHDLNEDDKVTMDRT